MTKNEAYTKIIYYLRSHYIRYYADEYKGIITMAYPGYLNCPDSIIESCFYFYSDCMECRVYYTELGSDIFKKSSNKANLYRFLNYINAAIWPCACDGSDGELYQPYHLHTPRFYVTEDNCYDITATTIIAYDFYEIAMLETEDYITACIPELMDKLSYPIFGILTSNMTISDSIKYVKTNVLNEE